MKHELISEDNFLEMLRDDIRSKIVGNVYNAVYVLEDHYQVLIKHCLYWWILLWKTR